MTNKKIISLFLFAFVLLSACEDEVTPPTTNTTMEYGSVSGIVMDSQTDEPIAGAQVEALLNQVADTTDSLGEYLLDSLIVGGESITVLAGFYDSRTLEITVSPDSQTVNVSMEPMVENQYLYIAEALGHNIYIIDVDKQEKVDSLYFSEGEIYHLVITPGGTKLYIFDTNGGNTYFLDTKTRTFHSTNLPNTGIIFSIYDDQLFLFSEEGIFIVDTLSDAAVQIDTIDPLGTASIIVFSPIAPVFYFSKRGLVFTYDYQQAMIIDSSKFSYWTIDVTPDGKELYFISDYVSLWDIQNDSIIEIYSSMDKSISHISHRSRIKITPNGEYALITEGGNSFNYIPPNPKGLITVISTNNHEFYGYIDLKPFGGTSLNILFTRSGRYAYINEDLVGRIILIDILNMKLLKSIVVDRQIGSMAIGPKN